MSCCDCGERNEAWVTGQRWLFKEGWDHLTCMHLAWKNVTRGICKGGKLPVGLTHNQGLNLVQSRRYRKKHLCKPCWSFGWWGGGGAAFTARVGIQVLQSQFDWKARSLGRRLRGKDRSHVPTLVEQQGKPWQNGPVAMALMCLFRHFALGLLWLSFILASVGFERSSQHDCLPWFCFHGL